MENDWLCVLSRFARILMLYVGTDGRNVAHVIWLEHSSKRLQEGHHPRELFLAQTCASLDPRAFHRKIQVDVLDPLGGIPIFDQDNLAKYFARFVHFSLFFNHTYLIFGPSFSWVWDVRDCSIQSLPPNYKPDKYGQLGCSSCESIILEDKLSEAVRVKITQKGGSFVALRYEGQEFHEGDYIYLAKPEQKASRLPRIAKIVDIGRDGSTIRVLKFKYDLDHPSGDRSVSIIFLFSACLTHHSNALATACGSLSAWWQKYRRIGG